MDKALIESIAVEDGKILDAKWHEMRFRKSFRECYGKEPQRPLLDKWELKLPPKDRFKLRIVYNVDERKTTLIPYFPKSIKTLKTVACKHIVYHLKYADRSAINALFEQRGRCDDVLIIRGGMVSDTSTGNILFLKEGQWFTPDTPLLEGTKRAKLLSEGKIHLKSIKKEDISNFECFMIVNALRPFDENNSVPVENILQSHA